MGAFVRYFGHPTLTEVVKFLILAGHCDSAVANRFNPRANPRSTARPHEASMHAPMSSPFARNAVITVATTLILSVLNPASAQAPADPAQAAAKTTSSGLIYRSLKEGGGPSPKATDVVKVHYRGTFPDGKEFDSSYKRNEPTQFPLNGVIPCWTEGVQLMKVGGKAKLTCPPAIAYGSRGAGGVIPPNATLDFEIELLEIAGRK